MPGHKIPLVTLWLAVLAMVVPILFVYQGKEWANCRNWHFAVVGVALTGTLVRGNRHGDFLSTPISQRLWTALSWASLTSLLATSFLGFWALSVNGMDFSIFDWMLYNSSHRTFMTSPVCDGCNHMGIHTSWVLWPLVPVHRVFPHPLMLQTTQALTIWLGQFPLRRMARHYLKNEFLAFLVVMAYLSNSWVGSIVNHGFHFEVFFIASGLFMLDGWTRQRPWLFGAGLLVFLATKEDGAFYTTAFALGVLAHHLTPTKTRRAAEETGCSWERRAAILTLALSLLVAAFNFGWAQPHFLKVSGIQQPRYLGRFWGRYGQSKTEILSSMMIHPSWVIEDVLTGGWTTVFGSLLFIPLLSLQAAVTFIPFLLINGTASSDDQQMRDFAFYYSAPLLPFLFWGFLRGSRTVRSLSVRLLKQFSSRHWLGKQTPDSMTQGVMALAALLFSLNTGGYQRFPAPEIQALRDLDVIRSEGLGNSGQKICVQLAFFPHLPYHWDLEPLYQECLQDPNKIAIIGLPFDPNPHTEDVLRGMISRGVIVRTFPSGITVVRGQREPK